MRLWNRTREQMGPEAREIFARQPEQDDAMGVCLNAWETLQTCRPGGMVEGWIPWDKCDLWCQRHGLDDDAARILWAVIHRCDIAELEHRAFEARSRPALPPQRR